MHYVVIGNSAAGIGGVEGIRKIDKDSKITLISDEPYHTYSRPLISYFLAGKVNENNMKYRESNFYQINNVEPKLGIKVVWIDFNTREVILGNNEKINYDRLLIAVGGKPFIPSIEGWGKEGVYCFSKLDDAKILRTVCIPGAKAIIIGAGLIGLKAAEALRLLGVDVTVVELANRILSSILDEEAAGIVQNYLESHQIKFILNNTVKSFNGNEKVESITLMDNTTLECDFIVLAIGVIPNVDMVKDTPLTVNRGIVVDKFMRTNIEGVYAAGDVCEAYDLIYGMQRVIPILPCAYRQGEIAGQNMAGGNAEYEGGFAMNSIGFFGLPMITAGIVKPDGEGFEVLVKKDLQRNIYKKLILKDNKIVGYIYLNSIDRAGIITNLIREKIDVNPFKEEILDDNFGYVNLPKDYRRQKIFGLGVVGA